MARSFKQVLAEVSAKSDPQRKLVLGQIAALPGQQQAEEASLSAQKDQAFEDILGGARRRGLGFSGIPLGEQAKYSATEYAPAVARLKTGFGERRGTLESALADIGRGDYMSAQDIFGRDQQMAEQRRQFDLNYRLQQQQAADARRAASASSAGSGFSPTLGSVLGTTAPKPPDKNFQIKQQAQAGVQEMMRRRSDPSFYRELIAINKSAGYGNPIDRAKLELLQIAQPGLFNKGKLNTSRISALAMGRPG